MTVSSRSLLVLAVLALGAVPALAQRSFTFGGGLTSYDLQGAQGTGWVATFRFDTPVKTYMVAEPGVTFLRWQPVAGTKITYLLMELGLQLQGYLGPLRPYIGPGIGVSAPTRGAPGTGQNYLLLHAAAGVRMRVSRGWGVRAEVRARSIRPWTGTTYDFTLGIMQVQQGFR